MSPTSHCACGALRAEITELPPRSSVCHCHACRTRTGSAFSWNMRVPRAAVTITGAATAYVRIGDEGSRITHHFCPTCGVTVWYENDQIDAVLIPVGALAPGSGPAPRVSVYDNRRPDWLRLDEAIEAWD